MKLKVRVTKEVFYRDGWGIFACDVESKDKDKVILNKYGNFSIKGNTVKLLEDEWYDVELGELEKTPKGDSYPILKVLPPKNVSSKAQYQFLQSQMTEKQFQSLCKFYPLDKKLKIVDMVKSGEVKLTDVKGINEDRADKILKRINDNEDMLYLINKLAPLGVSNNTISKIANHYKSPNLAVQKINESMYNLCEIKGLGFKKVDTYALTNGEDREGFKRIEACINYLIHMEAQEGHSWTDANEMIEKAVKLLEIDEHHIKSFLFTLDMSESNVKLIDDKQVTSSFYHYQEQNVLRHLQRINNSYNTKIPKKKLAEYIKIAEDSLNITYTEEQSDTLYESFEHGVYIINGKGGVGKSYLIKGITTICENVGLDYIAIALSGRAAQLLDIKGIESSTIHRALGYDGDKFIHNENNPLYHDVIILEEASMVNAYLWNCIVQSVKDGAKLIIVGDSGQLSGIGNGDVLRDLLQTQHFKGRELKQIHRQAQDSGIIEVAGKIREGENVTGYNWTLSDSYGKNNDLYLFTYTDKIELLDKSKQVIKNQMEKLDKDSLLDFQILVSNKSRGELSTPVINKYCQSIYNDLTKPFVANFTHEFRVDDKVIISGNKYKIPIYKTINDYRLNSPIIEIKYEDGERVEKIKEHSLFNGTMGIVVDINTDKQDQSVLVEFEGFDGYIKLTKEEMSDLDLAYAITVSKSQGITVKNTLFLLDFGAFKLLSKQLVYTAITRASDKCVVMAENNALHKAIGIDSSLNRKTFLKQMIEELQ